ncbi:MAG: alkaline phosphatase family protein, partial [bacterium]
MESNKQVVVGLDGATFDLIEPWVEEGKLPHFEKFMWQGSWGELETTYPPLTAPAWSSFMTGCNPGKHGIYDFLSSDPSSDEVVDYTSIEPPTLWDLFSQNNRKVGLVNLPVTYPPPDVNGHVISGLLSSNDRDESAYPPGLIQELEQKTGRTWWPEVRDSAAPSNPLEFLDAQLEANETIAQFSLTLLEEYDYDFFMCMLDATDFIAHFFWHYMEEDHPYYEDRGQRYENAVLSAYQQVDSFLERLDEQVGENTDVMIMSDHGFGRIEKMVNLNNFFEERDYLVQKKTPMTLLKRGMRAIGLHPSRVMKIVEALGLDSLVFLV